MRGHRQDNGQFEQRTSSAKAAVALSSIIGRYTTLKKRGPREMVGLCVFHSERTPSMEVNDAKGTYHCHGCGESGDHLRFMVRHLGMSFMDALRDLEGGTYPEVTEAQRAQLRREEAQANVERLRIARQIWENAVPPAGTPAEVYARSRGITKPLPSTVRFATTPRWRDRETGEVGRDHPAMACAIHDAAGELVGVQCVFLADGGRRKYERVGADGKKAKAKLSFGNIVGSAFRASGMLDPAMVLADMPDEIIVCEGPEDGLTLAQEMPGKTVWATCGTAMMPRLMLPPQVRTIVLAGDNNEAGRTAIKEAADIFTGSGRAVRMVWPRHGFKDFNDQLRGIRA